MEREKVAKVMIGYTSCAALQLCVFLEDVVMLLCALPCGEMELWYGNMGKLVVVYAGIVSATRLLVITTQSYGFGFFELAMSEGWFENQRRYLQWRMEM